MDKIRGVSYTSGSYAVDSCVIDVVVCLWEGGGCLVLVLLCSTSQFCHHLIEEERASPEVIKYFSCSTQLSTKLKMLIKLNRQITKFFA